MAGGPPLQRFDEFVLGMVLLELVSDAACSCHG